MATETASSSSTHETAAYQTINQTIDTIETILYDNDHNLSLRQLRTVQARLEVIVKDLKQVTEQAEAKEDMLELASHTASSVASGFANLKGSFTKWARKRQYRYVEQRNTLASDTEEIRAKRSRYVVVLDDLHQKIPILSDEAVAAIRNQLAEILQTIDQRIGPPSQRGHTR